MIRITLTIIMFFVSLFRAEWIQGLYEGVYFSVKLQKDTIFIGEPLIIESKFVNTTEKKQIIPEPAYLPNVSTGTMGITLTLPNGSEVGCQVGIHASLTSWPYTILAPRESVITVFMVDLHTFFGWNGYLTGDNLKEIKMAEEGICTLKIGFPYPSLATKEKPLPHALNINLFQKVPFYWLKTRKSEYKILKKLCDAHITWEFLRLGEKKQFDVLKEVMNSNSIFAPYAHYQYAYSIEDPEEKLLLYRQFIKKYPDSILEKLVWGHIVSILNGLGKKEEANQELQKLQKKHPGYIKGNKSIEIH